MRMSFELHEELKTTFNFNFTNDSDVRTDIPLNEHKITSINLVGNNSSSWQDYDIEE